MAKVSKYYLPQNRMMNKTINNGRSGLPLSVVIITCNEEKNIQRCIVNAKRVSDDIVVIDSGSTDNTVFLAERKGARVFRRAWNGYSSQKNYGNNQAKHDLILSIDADEMISKKLAASIKSALKNYEPGTFFR